jgi:hypothetical protein
MPDVESGVLTDFPSSVLSGYHLPPESISSHVLACKYPRSGYVAMCHCDLKGIVVSSRNASIGESFRIEKLQKLLHIVKSLKR